MDDNRVYYAIAVVFGCVGLGGLISGNVALLSFLVLGIVFAGIARQRS